MAVRVLILLALVACIQSKVLNLSCQQIKKFVDGHNIRRQQLAKGEIGGQPAASEMKFMIWDHELAAKAEKWASEYRESHNPDKSVGSGRWSVGENLYWYSITDFGYKLDANLALTAWFDEHKDYTYGPLSSSDFGGPNQIGHYTQMAWSDSTHLGCAISQFNMSGWNKFMVVCNYGPTGNYLGQRPYKSGNPAGHLICTVGDCGRAYGDHC
ncbi:venom allergen 5-like [Ostrinia nubilalis]|uniref:venom allergen 5-like n=1 Tax=Ostrinia nubilalis TaxID=29057 RepID=UPI00308250EA